MMKFVCRYKFFFVFFPILSPISFFSTKIGQFIGDSGRGEERFSNEYLSVVLECPWYADMTNFKASKQLSDDLTW